MEAGTLCVYAIIERKGKNDRYIEYMLNALGDNYSKVVVVLSDNITEEEKKFFESKSFSYVLTDKKASLCEMYYMGLMNGDTAEYSSFVFCNSRVFGPIYPLETIDKIVKGNGDFYGISDKVSAGKIGNLRYDNKEILSLNFFILKKAVLFNLIENKKFHHWKKLDEVAFAHEISEYIIREGYTYVPLFGEQFDNFDSMGKVKNGCPFIEEDKLFGTYIDVLSESRGEETRRLLKYIGTNTDYNVDMVYEHILKVYNISDIYNGLHLNYMLSSKEASDIKSVLKDKKAVMVIHLFYTDLINYFYDYILGIPESIDIIITTTDYDKGKIIEEVFKPVLKERVRIVVSQGNGRELAALLVETREMLKPYDYICFTHDKKSLHTGSASVSRGFQQLIVENILNSREYITNIIKTFEDDKRLGLLVPPPPMHGIYFASLGRRWTLCYEPVCKLLEELNVHTDVDAEKNPLATGSAFWCRKEAILPILEKNWGHNDFPEEPMANDGTISHAIERSFPFIAQSQGFYTGMVMTLENASLEFTNREFVLEKMHISMHNIIPTYGQNIKTYSAKIDELGEIIGIKEIGVKDAVKNYINKIKNKVSNKFNIRSLSDTKKLKTINNSKLFDGNWYIKEYDDVRVQGVDPAWHYLTLGWKEGRDASAEFSTAEYFRANPDVRAAEICPLYHFEICGKFEGRQYKQDASKQNISLVYSDKEEKQYEKYLNGVINSQKKIADSYQIQNNKIVFKTFQSDYTCNPKYICEEILKRKLPYDIVWITKNEKEAIGNYPNGVRVVSEGSPEAKAEIYSAKVLVDNGVHLFSFKELKKPGQIYICTWHGSLGFKKLAGNKLASKRVANSAKLYNDTNDLVISNSTFEDEVFRKSYWPTAKFIECGHPRNDILISNDADKNEEIKAKVYNKLGIPKDMKVILYAPTFREKLVDSNGVIEEVEDLDYNALIKSLEEKFGGKWGVIIRAHFVDSENAGSDLQKNCFAGTKYSDIQELMVAADAALTDYSSWILDYMFTRKPAFLFTPDYDDYDTQRGFCYPLSEAPFQIAMNNHQLSEAIINFDDTKYKNNIEEFLLGKGSREDGNGSKAVVDIIEKIIKDENK